MSNVDKNCLPRMTPGQRAVLTMLAAGGQVRVNPNTRRAALYEPENGRAVANVPWRTFAALANKRLVAYARGETRRGREYFYYAISGLGHHAVEVARAGARARANARVARAGAAH